MAKNVCLNTAKEIDILEKAVNYLNIKLFDNELSKVKITIAPDNGKISTYGWAGCGFWKNQQERAHELNITANSLKRPFKEIWVTLVHELIHIYAYSTGDTTGATSRQGRYHGKKFKELCDKFYLYTEKDDTIGYVTPHCKLLKEQQELYKNFTKPYKNLLPHLFKYQRIGQEVKKGKNQKDKTFFTYQEAMIAVLKKVSKMPIKVALLESGGNGLGILTSALVLVQFLDEEEQIAHVNISDNKIIVDFE